MKINLFDNVKSFWDAYGSFGELKGKVASKENEYSFSNESICFSAKTQYGDFGVCSRKDVLENISDNTVTLNYITSKMTIDNSEYEIYTQNNCWQNESTGGWHTFVSEVGIHCESVRNTQDAAPFIALWNKQTNRGIAMHLVADGPWKINVTRKQYEALVSYVEIEFGIDCRNLELQLASGEKFELPEILYYEFTNKTDMDCYKLHHYFNNLYPRREVPVIYNSWMYCFSDPTCENILCQIPYAQKVGAEYFVIDAGWFGDSTDWGKSIGDWTENENAAFCGNMSKVAEEVRKHGMKFGLWHEIERAIPESKAVAKYPDYFIEYEGNCFLDFANPDARKYIMMVLDNNIEKYGIEFIKFDFNANLCFDKRKSGFTEYFKGYRTFIKDFQDKYPNIYCSNCASGGTRMSLSNCKDFGSFWFSDNQSPYDGLEIIKNSILRLSPQVIERWVAVQSIEGIREYGEYTDRLIATNNATWDEIVGIDMSYLKGFMTGGPIGFSCDFTKITNEHFAELQDFVTKYKKHRDFWSKASCRILCDTPSLLALQYSDESLENIAVVVFAKKFNQFEANIYPVINDGFDYEIDNKIIKGTDIAENGIDVKIKKHYASQTIYLKRK